MRFFCVFAFLLDFWEYIYYHVFLVKRPKGQKFVNNKGFDMGKKICVYIKNDAEADFVRAAIKQHRASVDFIKTDKPILSSAQQYMLDTVMNAINNIHGAQHPNTFEPVDAPVIKPKVDLDKLFGVVED